MFSRLFGKKKSTPAPAPVKSTTSVVDEKLPSDMTSWSGQHVAKWLTQNDLKEYTEAFSKNAISGAELVDLSEKELESIGVKKLGSRKKIMKLISDQVNGVATLAAAPSIIVQPAEGASTPLSSSVSRKNSFKDSMIDEDELSSDSMSSSAQSSMAAMRPAALPTAMPDHMDQKYALFDDLPDGTIVINADKSILFVNKSVERIFLYPRSELLGCNIKVLMTEPHRSQHDGYVDKYLNGGKAHVIGKGRMVEAKAKDNSLVPIWLSVTEAADDDGNKIFIGSCKDLRSVNPVSRSAQNKMLMLLDNLVDAAVVMNTSSQIIFFNKSAENLFGFTKDETIGQCIEMLIPPEIAVKHKTFVENYMQTKVGKVIGKGRNVEILKKDGTRQPVFFSLTETKWGEGNSTAFCATLQPLNELVDAKKNAGQLKNKVAEQEKILDPNDPLTRQLQEVIDSQRGRQVFKEFLTQVKTVEPMLFIEAIDEYIVLKSSFYRFKTAQQLYETFIKHGARKELNLPSSIKQELLGMFVEKKVTQEYCPANVFQTAYAAVLADMKNDLFNRFVTTNAYKSLLEGPESIFSK